MNRATRKHKNEDFVHSDYELGGELTRTIVMAASNGIGHVRITELSEDENVISILGGHAGPGGSVSVQLDAGRMHDLLVGIASLSGSVVLEPDLARATEVTLTDKIRDVLCANESRCLDDDIDREVVLRELVKALTGS